MFAQDNNSLPVWIIFVTSLPPYLHQFSTISGGNCINAFKLHGATPHTVTTGDEGDISNLCLYGWYEWCYFRDQTAAFPNNKEVLGRVLGPARGAGNEMAQWILKANGRVVPRRSLRPLKVDEIHSPVEIKKREVFDELIMRRWGTPMTPPNTQQPKAF